MASSAYPGFYLYLVLIGLIPSGNSECGEGYTEVRTGLGYSYVYRRRYFGPVSTTPAATHCVDKNECEVFGTCSQICTNLEGSYNCSCVDGFKINSANSSSCVPEEPSWKLLYATETGQLGYLQHHANGTEERVTSFIPLNVTSTNQTVAVTYDFRSNIEYWTNVSLLTGAIYKMSLEDEGEVEIIADVGLQTPAGIAFDWITGNVYFTDSSLNYIGVCSNSTEAQNLCHVLLTSYRMKKLGDVALYPNKGLIFWTEMGTYTGIYQAGMDGSLLTLLIPIDDLKPNGLVLDYAQNRLYFMSGVLPTCIESIRLDGTDRRVVVRSDPITSDMGFGLDIFGDRIIWSQKNEIHSASKLTGLDKQVLVSASFSTRFSGIAVANVVNQPVSQRNPCEAAGCSHICTIAHVNASSMFTCICPKGMALEFSNKKICKELENAVKLAVVYNSTLSTLRIGSIGRNVFDTEQLPNVTSISAVVYNQMNHTLILNDPTSKSVYEYDLVNKTIWTLLENVEVTVLDLDPVGENLYWVAGGTMEVMSLRTRARLVLQELDNLENSVDLLVAAQLGVMFVAVVDGDRGEIYKLDLNGESKQRIYRSENSSSVPIALALDSNEQPLITITWLDRGGRVHNLIVDGSLNTLYSPELPGTPTDLVVLENCLYLANKELKLISTFSSRFKTPRHIKDANFSSSAVFNAKLAFIERNSYILRSQRRRHECSAENQMNGCSHLCLISKTDFIGECRCPEGLALDRNGKTCVIPTKCPAGEFVCNDDTCLQPKLVCDGIADCPSGGEDEGNCTVADCPADTFKCESYAVCVPKHWLCDGEGDCADLSDEKPENCPAVLTTITTKKTTTTSKSDIYIKCPPGFFTCTSGRCISPRSICDGRVDCPGGDDEIHCAPKLRETTTEAMRIVTKSALQNQISGEARNDQADNHQSTSSYTIAGGMVLAALLVAVVAFMKMRMRRVRRVEYRESVRFSL